MSSELEQPESFDYTQLDAETREIVLRATGETQSLLQRTAEHIFAIGHNLRLAQWPSPLDALAFEAEDWRLAQMAELTRGCLMPVASSPRPAARALWRDRARSQAKGEQRNE